ncbi:MAG: uroporphyrinogen-III synthase [Nanoarchaeota archaeon]|nr:uroporphyrinogen-III synthase [Nanoarchaeota archaeon]
MALPSGPAVVLTREREDNVELSTALREAGVPVLEIPCVETRYIRPEKLPAGVDAVVFTSRRGVRGLFLLGNRSELLPGEKTPVICAVGKATAEALAEEGFASGIVAEPPRGEVLAKLLTGRLPAGARVAVVRGNLRAGGLDEALERAGYRLEPVMVYENIKPEIPALEPVPVAAVFVASPSAGKRLLEANPWLKSCDFLAIGPTTAAALGELGVKFVEALEPDPEGWSEAICKAYRRAVDCQR